MTDGPRPSPTDDDQVVARFRNWFWQPPRRHGEVCVDAEGRVTSFREKPDDPRSNLAGICVYLFPPAVTELLDEYLEGGGNADAPGHFIAWLTRRTRVRATAIEGTCHDLGNLETLEAVRNLFAEREGDSGARA